MSVHAPREPERRDELHEFTSSLTPDTLKRELQPSSLEFNLQVALPEVIRSLPVKTFVRFVAFVVKKSPVN